jgi:minor extracellular protease Epr
MDIKPAIFVVLMGLLTTSELAAQQIPSTSLPPRLPVIGTNGNEIFVEILLAPGIRAVEREWVMLVNADQRQMLMREAPTLMQFLDEMLPFATLNSFLLKFRVPAEIDTESAVMELVPEPLRQYIDRNHVYSAQAARPDPQSSLLPLPMTSVCETHISVGMIDSAVRVDHPAFSSSQHKPKLVTHAFIDQDLPETSGHGTAVAGVMIGMGEGLQPLLPNATLYSASVVYAQDAYNQGASVFNLLQALDWLVVEPSLQVINISMTGPANRLLQQGVAGALRYGKVIVAAAGNEGPFAQPLYPAAYDGVIAATAVTVDGSIYRWANQGDHIGFAAFGVSVPTARGDGTIGRESGTSMAAPVISAFVACELSRQQGNVTRALDSLRSRALDMGAPGRDPVYGHGLLHP